MNGMGERDIHELVIDRISLIMNGESSLHLVERDHKDLLRRIQVMEEDKEMMEFDAEMEDESRSLPFLLVTQLLSIT